MNYHRFSPGFAIYACHCVSLIGCLISVWTNGNESSISVCNAIPIWLGDSRGTCPRCAVRTSHHKTSVICVVGSVIQSHRYKLCTIMNHAVPCITLKTICDGSISPGNSVGACHNVFCVLSNTSECRAHCNERVVRTTTKSHSSPISGRDFVCVFSPGNSIGTCQHAFLIRKHREDHKFVITVCN